MASPGSGTPSGDMGRARQRPVGIADRPVTGGTLPKEPDCGQTGSPPHRQAIREIVAVNDPIVRIRSKVFLVS